MQVLSFDGTMILHGSVHETMSCPMQRVAAVQEKLEGSVEERRATPESAMSAGRLMQTHIREWVLPPNHSNQTRASEPSSAHVVPMQRRPMHTEWSLQSPALTPYDGPPHGTLIEDHAQCGHRLHSPEP